MGELASMSIYKFIFWAKARLIGNNPDLKVGLSNASTSRALAQIVKNVNLWLFETIVSE